MTKQDSERTKVYANEHPKGKKPFEDKVESYTPGGHLEKNILLQGGPSSETIGMNKEEKKEYKIKIKKTLKDLGAPLK